MANESTIYVRNARPNTIVFHYAGTRYKLEHRGSRLDSAALPKEAQSDPNVMRWLQQGQLEKISKDAFLRLGTRQVDTLPNEYLDRSVRKTNARDVVMKPAEADTTRSNTQVDEGDVHKTVRDRLTPKWAGELMTTEEELEDLAETQSAQNYPSKHRDSGARQQMGY